MLSFLSDKPLVLTLSFSYFLFTFTSLPIPISLKISRDALYLHVILVKVAVELECLLPVVKKAAGVLIRKLASPLPLLYKTHTMPPGVNYWTVKRLDSLPQII